MSLKTGISVLLNAGIQFPAQCRCCCHQQNWAEIQEIQLNGRSWPKMNFKNKKRPSRDSNPGPYPKRPKAVPVELSDHPNALRFGCPGQIGFIRNRKDFIIMISKFKMQTSDSGITERNANGPKHPAGISKTKKDCHGIRTRVPFQKS